MARIDFPNDRDGKFEQAHGSDGRLNVSSRSDDRIYYISRDESLAFSMVFDDAAATAADYIAYLKNTDTNGRHMILHGVGVNSDSSSSFKLHSVTGTSAGGATVTPACLNRAVPKSAAATATATANSGSTPMSGLTSDAVLGHVSVVADGHEEFRIEDSVRIGQDQAVAIEFEQGTGPSRVWGAIFFYYE